MMPSNDKVPDNLRSFIPKFYNPPVEKPKNRLGKWVDSLKSFFKGTNKREVKLLGRVSQIDESAVEILKELERFIDQINKNVDPRLAFLIQSSVEPIVKEIKRQQSIVDQHEGLSRQVKNYHRYCDLLDRAKDWTSLDATDEISLRHKVFDGILDEFSLRIDKDLQVIEDYLNHALREVIGNDDIQDRIEVEVLPLVIRFQELKELPKYMSGETLDQWKSRVEQERTHRFSEVLHMIDLLTQNLDSNLSVFDDDSSISQFLSDVDALQEKVKNNSDVESMRQCFRLYDKLEDEAHRHNSNLRLNAKEVEQIQEALEKLNDIRDSLPP